MNNSLPIFTDISRDHLLLVLRKMRLPDVKRFERTNFLAGVFVEKNFNQIHRFHLEKLVVDMAEQPSWVVPAYDGSDLKMDLYATKYRNEQERVDCSYLVSNPQLFTVETVVLKTTQSVSRVARFKLELNHHFPFLLQIRCQNLLLGCCEIDWSSVQNHFVYYRHLSVKKCSAEFLQTLPHFCEEIDVQELTGTVKPKLLWRKFTKIHFQNIDLWECASSAFRKAELAKYIAALSDDSCKLKQWSMQNAFTGMFADLTYLDVPFFKVSETKDYTYYWLSTKSRIVALSISDLFVKLKVMDVEDLDTLSEELLFHNCPEIVDNSNCFTRIPVDLSKLYTTLSSDANVDAFQVVRDFIHSLR